MKTPITALALTLSFGLAATTLLYAADDDSTVDTAPGPAFQTIEGKLKAINGNVYVVDEYITNYRGEEIKEKEVQVYVNSETKKVHGGKKVGDKIRVEVTRGGFANSIE